MTHGNKFRGKKENELFDGDWLSINFFRETKSLETFDGNMDFSFLLVNDGLF